MTKTQQLLKRLREELGIPLPEDTLVKRTRSGYLQKSAGAWSWFLYSPTHIWVSDYGSPDRVVELCLATKLEVYDNPNGHKEIWIKQRN
jgi:hypothetical protein